MEYTAEDNKKVFNKHAILHLMHRYKIQNKSGGAWLDSTGCIPKDAWACVSPGAVTNVPCSTFVLAQGVLGP